MNRPSHSGLNISHVHIRSHHGQVTFEPLLHLCYLSCCPLKTEILRLLSLALSLKHTHTHSFMRRDAHYIILFPIFMLSHHILQAYHYEVAS